jgi:ribosomal protein L37AE/L43A
MIYVCDRCGVLTTRHKVREGDIWTCDTCGGHAAWEYPAEQVKHAADHSAHITYTASRAAIMRATEGGRLA